MASPPIGPNSATTNLDSHPTSLQSNPHMPQSSLALKIDPTDNVFVALQDLAAGSSVDGIELQEAIPAKHKFAESDLAIGDTVTMYGVTVGKSTAAIPRGGLLTTQNIAHQSGAFSTKTRDVQWSPPDTSRWAGRTFDGYHRSDGSVGTANHWIIIPMVFCENRNVDVLREALTNALGYRRSAGYEALAAELASRYREGQTEFADLELGAAGPGPSPLFENIDGIKFLSHGLGCGGTRDDAASLCGLLAGYVCHPNVAGATVLSLGCQNAEVSLLEKEIAARRPNFDKPLLIFEQQKHNSEQQMLTEAIRQTFAGMARANQQTRQPAPLSKLTIGVECGGSDGFSGISANPAIGHCSDLLVALGGTAILSEFPELCGVEQELCDRCTDQATADRFADLMRRYNTRAEESGSCFFANPSPGNIRDGLITDAMKPAGAAKKGGTSPVTDVLDYPGWASSPGLTLLCTPGNDVESTTAMAGAGANLLIFSTGLGTPTGNPVAPTLKVSTNSEIAKRHDDLIDFDAGPVIRGEKTIPEIGDELFEQIIATACGNQVPKAVRLGQDDFLPWKRGVSL